MSADRNPVRRPRWLPDRRSPRGTNRRLRIPRAVNGNDRPFWERIAGYAVHTRQVHGRTITVLVEPTRPGCVHGCSVDDVAHVLAHVPAADLDGLSLFVFRQPKRKEEILRPVWGRIVYHAVIGRHTGPTIFLEAVDPRRPAKWTKHLDPDGLACLDRLRADGHRVEITRHDVRIHVDPAALRATQLYGTLLHEIGHWTDYLRCVERPGRLGQDRAALRRRYFRERPRAEAERFADRYADEAAARLRAEGVIPFDPLPDGFATPPAVV
jgi:hypothetical protein